jgi:hypothetical protein
MKQPSYLDPNSGSLQKPIEGVGQYSRLPQPNTALLYLEGEGGHRKASKALQPSKKPFRNQ